MKSLFNFQKAKKGIGGIDGQVGVQQSVSKIKCLINPNSNRKDSIQDQKQL
ncbi:unnamed protein product [Paramecium primaurelia]|uniref:Uncharacterized protein n=1 Tax=Paramecium primaurelia TaxID=5886 RepID=A0A8S1M8K5_PARPR|nr:unnamed protein product [Paramecium primaurelia]CAD8102647.1 unnamed protein product [Paramecium primaurelia]CAD8102651.1 unnamed protein product [Paramecium primaurelia]